MKPTYCETDVLDEPAVGPVEQRHGGDALRAALRERAREEGERQAGVDDVRDEDHVAPLDRRVEILEQADAATPPVGVARELDQVDRVQDRDRPREVGEEDGARLQRRHEHGLAAVVVRGDRSTELADAGGDLGSREVDLSGGVVSYDASFSRYRWARRSRSRR